MVAGLVLLAQHRDVMVGAIHGRAHQVGCAGIHTDVLLVDVLFVQHRRDQAAVRSQHITAHLGEERHIPHSSGNQNFLKLFADALADLGDIVAALLRAIGDAYAARQVDELDLGTRALMKTHRQTEQDARQFRVILIGDRIAGQERVNAELFGAQGHQFGVGLRHLVLAHTIFGIAGVIHDAIAQVKDSTRIVAAADGFGNTRHPLQELHVGQIIQVDVGAQFVGLLHILHRRIVGGEHDITPRKTARLTHQQFGIAGAVHAAAFLLQDFQDIRIGRSFYGEIFFESFVPGKRRIDTAGILPDSLFIIQVERRRHVSDDGLGLFQRHERQFLRHFSFLSGFPQITFRTFVL